MVTPSSGGESPRVLLLALVVALLLVAAQMVAGRPTAPEADAMDYLKRAVMLSEYGVYSDVSPPPPVGAPAPPPGRYVAPLYPAFLAAVMSVDGRFREAAACAARQYFIDFEATPAVCGVGSTLSWGSIFLVQSTLAAGALFAVWLAARRLGATAAGAWTAMVLAAASGVYGDYAHQFLTEALVLPLGTALMLVLAEMMRRPRARLALLAGVLAGVAALVRPTFAYVAYATVAAALLLALTPRARRAALIAAGAVALGYALAVAPWMLRNLTVFGDTALTGRYADIILAQRVAYNAMPLDEWLASFVYWMPDFGDDLGRALFGAETVRRLDWFSPDSYYVLSLGAWREAFIEAAGGREQLLGWLLWEKVIGDLPKHLAVTLPLILRGLWVSKYFGLIGALFLIPALVVGLRRRAWPWLAFCAVPLFLLVLHAGVSPSIPRYNLLLIPCMAIATGTALAAAGRRLTGRGGGPYFRPTEQGD